MTQGSAKAAESPLPTGRLLTYSDITPQLKGRQAEVCFCLSSLLPQCWLQHFTRGAGHEPAGNHSGMIQCLHVQLFWPDDKMWYLVEIHSIMPKNRTAK